MNKTRYYGIVFFTIFLMLSLPITQAQFAPATENNVGSLQTIFNRNTGSDSGGIPQEIGDIQNMLDSAPSTWAGIPPVPHEAGIEAWADNALNKFPPRDYSANELRGFSRIASRLGDEYNMFNQAANLFNVNDEEMCVVPTDDAGLALMDPSGASVNTFTSEQGGRPSAGQAILPPDGTQDNRGAGGGAISMYKNPDIEQLRLGYAQNTANDYYLNTIARWLFVEKDAGPGQETSGVVPRTLDAVNQLQGLAQDEDLSHTSFPNLAEIADSSAGALTQGVELFSWAYTSFEKLYGGYGSEGILGQANGLVGDDGSVNLQSAKAYDYLQSNIFESSPDYHQYSELNKQLNDLKNAEGPEAEALKDNLRSQLKDLRENNPMVAGLNYMNELQKSIGAMDTLKNAWANPENEDAKNKVGLYSPQEMARLRDKAQNTLSEFKNMPWYSNMMNQLRESAAQQGVNLQNDFEMMWYTALNNGNQQLNNIINGGEDSATGEFIPGMVEQMGNLENLASTVGDIFDMVKDALPDELVESLQSQFDQIQESITNLNAQVPGLQQGIKDVMNQLQDDATDEDGLTDDEIGENLISQGVLAGQVGEWLKDYAKTVKELIKMISDLISGIIDDLWEELSKEPEYDKDGKKVGGGVGETPGPPCSIFPPPPCLGCPTGIYGKKEALKEGGATEEEAESAAKEAEDQQAIEAAAEALEELTEGLEGLPEGLGGSAGTEDIGEDFGDGETPRSTTGDADVATGNRDADGDNPAGATVVGITGYAVAGVQPGEIPGGAGGSGPVPMPPEPTKESAECITRPRCPSFGSPPKKEGEEDQDDEDGEEGGEGAEAAPGEKSAPTSKPGEVKEEGDIGAGRSAGNPEVRNDQRRINSRVQATQAHDELARSWGLSKVEIPSTITYAGKKVSIIKVGNEIRIYIPGYESKPIRLNYDAQLLEYLQKYPGTLKKWIKRWFKQVMGTEFNLSKLVTEDSKTQYKSAISIDEGDFYEPVRGGLARVDTADERDKAVNTLKIAAEKLTNTINEFQSRLSELSSERQTVQNSINADIGEYRKKRAAINTQIASAKVAQDKARDIVNAMVQKVKSGELSKSAVQPYLDEYYAAEKKYNQLLDNRKILDETAISNLQGRYSKEFTPLNDEINKIKKKLDSAQSAYQYAEKKYTDLVDYSAPLVLNNALSNLEFQNNIANINSVTLRGESVANTLGDCGSSGRTSQSSAGTSSKKGSTPSAGVVVGITGSAIAGVGEEDTRETSQVPMNYGLFGEETKGCLNSAMVNELEKAKTKGLREELAYLSDLLNAARSKLSEEEYIKFQFEIIPKMLDAFVRYASPETQTKINELRNKLAKLSGLRTGMIDKMTEQFNEYLNQLRVHQSQIALIRAGIDLRLGPIENTGDRPSTRWTQDIYDSEKKKVPEMQSKIKELNEKMNTLLGTFYSGLISSNEYQQFLSAQNANDNILILLHSDPKLKGIFNKDDFANSVFSAIANAPSSPEQKKQEKDAVIELVSQLVGVTQINTQYLPELEQVKSEILSKRSQYWIAPENSAKRRQILEELKELEDKMRDLSLKISAANFYTRGQEFSIQDFQNLGIPSGINNKGEIEYKPITSILWNQDAKTVWKDMYDNLADTFSGSRGSESGKQERDRAYTSLKVLGDANEHLQREQQRLSLILQKFEKTKNEILSARGMTQTQYMLLEEGLSQAFNNLKESGAWVWDEVLPYISPFRHLFGNSNYKRDQDKELKNAILGAEEIKSKLRVNAQQIARNLEKMTGYSGLIEELAEQGDTLSVARLSWAMGLISTNTLENQLSYFEHDPKYASDSSAKSEIAQLRKDMETRSDSKMSYQLSKNKLESEGKFDEFIDEGIGILDYLNIPYLFQRSNDDDSFSKSAWLDKSSQDGFRVFKKIRELLKTKGINAKDINTGIYSAIHGLLNYENEPEATTEKVIPFIKEWLERNFGLTSSECNTMSDKELIDFAMYWTLYGANKVKELQGKLTGNDLARSAILLGDLRKEAGDLVRAASDYSLGMSAGTGEIAEIAAKSKWSTEIEENKKQNRRFLAQMYLDPLNLLPAAGLLVIITKLKKVQTIVQGLKALLDFTARISGLKYTAGLLVKAKNLIPGVRKLTPIKWGENFLGKYKQLYQGIEAESSIAAAKEAGFKIKKSSVKRGLGIRESTSAARLTKRQKSIDLMKKVIARNPSKENMAKLNKLIKGDAAATGTARLGLETLQQQSTVAQTVRKNTGFLASTLGRHLWGDTARYQGLIRKLTAQLGKAEKTGNAAEITKLNKQIYEATKLFNQAKAASISGKSYSFVGKIFSFIGTIFRTNLGETFTPIKKQVRIAEELPSSKATSIIVEHADDAKTGRISKSAYKSETAANTAAKEAEGTIPKKVTTKPPVEAPAQVYDVQAGVKKTSEKLGVDISDPALNPEMRATFNQDTALDLVRERIDPNAQVSDFAAEVDEISYGFAIKNKNGDDILLVSVQDDGETIIRSIDVAPEYRGKGLESKLSEIDDAMYRRSHADYKSITETTDMEIASDSIARGSAPNSYNTPLESEQLDRLLKGYSDEALHGDLGVGMELNGPMSKNLQKSYDEWSGVRSMMTGEGYAAEDIAIGLRRAGYELDDIRDVMKSDDFLMKSKASELGYGLDEIELDDLVNKIFEDASHKSQTLADSAKADAAKAGSEGLESLVASAERAELNLKRLAGDFDSAMFKKETFVASNAAPTAEELTRLKRLSLKKVNELKSKAADALNTPPTAAEREFTALYRGRPVSADPAELEEAIRTIIEQGEMSGAARQGRPISGVAEDTIREGIRKHQYDEQPFVISTSTSRDLAENFAITREINGKKYGSLIIEIDPKGIARGQLDISTALSADDLGRISKEGHFDPRLLNRPHSTGYEHEVLFIGDRIPSENIKAIYYDGQLVYGRDLATAEKATPKITAAPKTVAEAQGAVPTAKISPKPLREVGKGTAGKSIVYEGEVIVEGTGRQSAVKVFQRSEDVADELVNTKKLKDITIKDPSTGAQRPIARGIIGDGKITYEGKQGIAFEYLDGVPLQSDNVGEWSKLLNPNSGEQLDLIRTALKDKGLAIDDFQAMVLKTDQEIGGVMLRKGDVVVFDVEAITNVDELANVWKDLGKTPDEIESLIALEYRNLDAAVDAVKTRTPVVIEASTPEAAAKAAAEAKSAVPLPIPVEAKSTATRMRNFYGEFMKNPKYKSVYQNDEFMENLGKYMYDDVAKAKVDSIAAESGLTHSDIMGPKVLAEGGPAYADRLAGASNTAQDFSKTSGFLSPAETWVVESAVGGSDDVSLARFYDIFGNDPVVYNSLREEYITFLKNKGYVTEVYDGAFDSLRVAMDSSASRVASEFPETVLTVPKAAGPSTELRWTRRSGAAKDFASDFKVSTSAEEAIFTKMAGGTGPESKAVFFDAFDHPDVYATLKNDFMAYAQKEGLDTLAFDEAFTRIRSNMNKASADRAILEARASAPGIVRPGSLDDLGRQIAESDTVFARLNTQYDDAVSKHSAYQKYFDENANYVNFDEYQDMVAELDRLKRNVDDFDYYRTQEAFDRMQLELKYRVMKEAKAKSAAEAAKEALETVPIKAPTPGALPDDLLESQLSLSELQTRMALGSVDPSELKGISLGGKSHNAREITLGGKKFVIKYFREGDALAMTQLKNELAARKIIKKYFPEIGVPDAVAFVGSDGNTYLLSEFVDVGVDLDRFYNLPMGARSDLTVSELIFGLSDLSGENVLFNKQGRLFNIDLENFALDKYVPNKRGFKISVDWGFEPHFEKAVKEAGKTKHLPLSLEDDFGAALQKVNSLKSNPDFLADVRTTLKEVGYADDKIDDAVKAIKTNLDNFEDNLNQLIKWRDEIRKPVVSDVPVKAPTVPVTIQEIEKGIINDYKLSTKDMNPILPENGILRQGDEFIVKHPDLGEIKATMISDDAAEVIIPTYSGTVRPFEIKINPKYNLQQKQAQIRVGISEELVPKIRSRLNRYKGQAFKKGVQEKITPELLDKRTQEVIQSVFLEDPVMQEIAAKYLLTENPQVRAFIQEVVSDSGFVPKRNLLAMYNPTIKGVMVPELASAKDLVAMKSTVFHEFLHHALQVMPDAQRKSLMQRILQSEDFQKFSKFMKNSKLSSYREGTELLKVGEYISYKGQAIMSGESFILTPAADTITNLDDILKGRITQISMDDLSIFRDLGFSEDSIASLRSRLAQNLANQNVRLAELKAHYGKLAGLKKQRDALLAEYIGLKKEYAALKNQLGVTNPAVVELKTKLDNIYINGRSVQDEILKLEAPKLTEPSFAKVSPTEIKPESLANPIESNAEVAQAY